jgi:hypothetical protein
MDDLDPVVPGGPLVEHFRGPVSRAVIYRNNLVLLERLTSKAGDAIL